ncbi:MAG: rhomboid family intramembrane serine protease [Opitutales bacterium]
MAQYERRIEFNQPGGGRSLVITNLLIANALVFILQLISQEMAGPRQWPLVDKWFSLMPVVQNTQWQFPPFMPWQLLSYGFLHSSGNYFHILFNMFILWSFGKPLAQDFGERRFLFYYLTCVFGAGLLHLVMPYVGFPAVPVVGASGGVYGLLLAFGWRYPHTQIMLLIPPIPLKARTAVLLFGGFELVLGLTGTRTGIAHFAHLGGLLTGVLLLLYWRGKLPLKPKRLLP